MANAKARHTILLLLLLTMSLALAAPAATITLLDFGGAAPANAVGGGDLSAIMQQAASEWAVLYPEPFVLTIAFTWGPLGSGALAQHQTLAQEGTPNRETIGAITFENNGSSVFFLDSTPWDNSEFTTFTQSTADFGGGEMEVGRIWSGAVGAALGAYDLLSIARHEIGHALGLSSGNFSYHAEAWPDNDIDVTGPRPFAGAAIPTRNTAVPADASSSNAHLDIPTALLWPFVSESSRREISQVDFIANAQLSQFDPASAVPEPAAWLLVSFVLAGLGLARRSQQGRRSQPNR